MLKLSKMQNEFWRNCNSRWNIKEGATRSGKTYMDYFLIAKRIRESRNKPGLRVLIGNTRSTLERNIIDPMREIYGPDLIGNLRQNNTLDMFGEKVYALGADKVSQVARLQGSGIIYCYGDEITTWNEDVFQMLKSRLSYPTSVFDGTCNPDSPNHWFKKFLDSNADIYRQSYKIYDNPYLSESFIKNLEKEYEGTVYYNRFILGEWALAEGLIYQAYDIKHDPVDEIPEPTTGRRFVSCDYGTSNACVFLLFEEGQSGTWYISDEYYYSGRDSIRQKTDEEYCKDFTAFLKGKKVLKTVVDPSAASFITALRQHGYGVIKANNDVLNGIRKTLTKLNNKEIVVLRKCKHLLDEFGSYSWDSRKGEDVPIKENDHCCDALRYFVNTLSKLTYDPFN